MEQRSKEWFAARCGMITASRFKDVLAKTKSGPAATRESYKWQLVAERLTGEVGESYQNTAMRWGTETESQARAAYEWETGNEVEEVGFLVATNSDDDELSRGCSPDGLIDLFGGLEIKCPYNSAIHLKTVESGEMPAEHKAQVQGCLIITERDWWDYVSFDPRMPEKLKLFVVPVLRDEDYIKELTKEVDAFDEEIEAVIERLLA